MCYVGSYTMIVFYHRCMFENTDPLIRECVSWTLWVTAIMAWISWFACWKTNPGFLPYDWCVEKRHVDSFTPDEIRAGTAATFEQKKWAKEVAVFPPRAYFSGSVGLAIVKGDHFCGFIYHWIGLKNLRYFIQGAIWVALFQVGFLIGTIHGMRMEPRAKGEKFMGALFVIFSIFIFVQAGAQVFESFRKVVFNITLIERFSNMKQGLEMGNYNKGLLSNLEETFGSVKLCWLWWLPIPLPLPNDGMDFQERVEEPPEWLGFVNNMGELRSVPLM